MHRSGPSEESSVLVFLGDEYQLLAITGSSYGIHQLKPYSILEKRTSSTTESEKN